MSPTTASTTFPEPPVPGRHRIVIVGGGAGGLELAARLAPRLQADDHAEVVLIDAALTHVWKPQLHELAAGTLGAPDQETDYLQQARRHGFRFHLGRLESMDRAARRLWLAPLLDDAGQTVAPRSAVAYDTVVIAVGSVVNDFGTPGVREHAMALDTAEDARRFHRRLLAAWARNELQDGTSAAPPVQVAIVGGGATGVELAAELVESTAAMAGFLPHMSRAEPVDRTGPRLPVRIHLLEAGPRLLAALPQDVAAQAEADLRRRGVGVRTGVQVTGVSATQVMLGDEAVPADITVWAAGIRGPEVLQHLDGLEQAPNGQLVVGPTLQTTRDPQVLALGDCARCVLPDGRTVVPPRAQAAHQQAEMLAEALPRMLRGEPLPAFRYDDRGSLVSLGRRHAVGQVNALRGRGDGLRLDGLLARWAYWGLQRQHMVTLHGLPRTLLATVGGWLTARTMPPVKLH